MSSMTDIIHNARKEYNLTEEDMWKSIKILDRLLAVVEGMDKQEAERAKISFIDITNKGHFPLDFAAEIVAKLHSKGAKGEHWTIEQIDTTAKQLGLPFAANITSGDKLYAFNSFWHDMRANGDSEEKIFTDAFLFYFDDEDFEGNSKPWKYYKGMVW